MGEGLRKLATDHSNHREGAGHIMKAGMRTATVGEQSQQARTKNLKDLEEQDQYKL